MPKKAGTQFSRQNPIRVFLVDDHPIILDGFRSLILSKELKGEPITVAGYALTIDDALSKITDEREALPDILLLDIWLRDVPRETALDLIQALNQKNIHIPVLVYSGECVNTHMLAKLINMGISGYVMKNANLDILMEAMYDIAIGKIYFPPEIRKRINKDAAPFLSPLFHKILTLTPHELIVLKHLVKGSHPFLEIAQTMKIANSTLYNYTNTIKTKLGIKKLASLKTKEMSALLAIVLGENW